jgi:hypothetical protein
MKTMFSQSLAVRYPSPPASAVLRRGRQSSPWQGEEDAKASEGC